MLSKVLSKNCVSVKWAAKQPAPQKMHVQMLGRCVASLILQDLLPYKGIFCFCMQLGDGCKGKERLMKETIGSKQT